METRSSSEIVSRLRLRGHRTHYVASLCGVVYLAVFTYLTFVSRPAATASWSTLLHHVLRINVYHVTVLIVAEALYRILSLAEESSHLDSRYFGRVTSLLQKTFGWSVTSMLAVMGVVCSLCVTLEYLWHPEDALEVNRLPLVTVLALNSCGLLMFGLRGPSPTELSDLTEKNHLNVAHGLAWSYYLGYLRFILPGLAKRAQATKAWAAKEGGSRGSTKFFILMPESCYCPGSLTAADPSLTHEGEIEGVKVDRAGNVGRTYKNNMYSMKVGNQNYHCMVEYATPLMSLHDMTSCQEAGLSHEAKLEQMQLFLVTLENILKSAPECDGSYLLVPYKDKMADGSECSISSLLRDKIEEDIQTKFQNGL